VSNIGKQTRKCKGARAAVQLTVTVFLRREMESISINFQRNLNSELSGLVQFVVRDDSLHSTL